MTRVRATAARAVVVVALAAGCTGSGAALSLPPSTTSTTSTPSTPSTPSTTVGPSAAAPATPTSVATSRAPLRPFDQAAAMRTVAALARLGPRDAVSLAYRRAADLVAAQLGRIGYVVSKPKVPMPAGTSWGVRVPAGTSVNVIAQAAGFDVGAPHVVIGAHLDTVPQSPGAEDNASGIAVLLETARVLRDNADVVRLPVRFVAFAGEESRGGSGTGSYAFGSRRYLADLTSEQRRAVVAMVSLDRVGVRSPFVPVCHGGRGTRSLAAAIRAAAAPTKVATASCLNRASDHVSFESLGIPAARLGSVPYPAYHSAKDVPAVVDPTQLERAGTVLWSWLSGIRPTS